MARNLAHIVVLLYTLWLLYVSHGVLMQMLRPRLSRRELHFLARGLGNRYLLLSAKNQLPALLFWLNFGVIALFCFHAALSLVLGWFSFMSTFMKVLNSITVMIAGVEAAFLSVVANQMKFGKPFVLYEPLPEEAKVFASSILDAVLYLVLPLLVLIFNATGAIPA